MKTLRNMLKSLAYTVLIAVTIALIVGAVVTTIIAAFAHFGIWTLVFMFSVCLWGIVHADMQSDGKLE